MRVLFAVGACLPLLACATTDGLEQELSRMRRDMRGMQQELSETRRQVERLEGRVTLLSLGKGAVQAAPKSQVAGARPAAPPAAPAGGQKVLPVVRLGASAEAATAAVEPPAEEGWVDPGALDQGQPPLEIRLGPSEDAQDTLPVDHGVLKKKDPVLHAEKKASPRDAYQAALDALRKDNDPQLALRLFRAFLAENPGSKLSDNAAYWSGECLYILARYEESIVQMELVADRYPKSAKVPHALLRAGESWLALGDRSRGLAALRKVRDAYPTSDAARRAGARLEIEGGN
jgi:tol-pal system protein YbgF